VISKELEGRISRLYFNEKWSVGAIAANLRVHHSVVTRVISMQIEVGARSRPSKIDPFLPFIREQLEKYPNLTASRLHQMCVERGYLGKQDWFRELTRRLRPRRVHEAFARRTVLKGEEAQVDWGHFGKIKIGSWERPLMAFVMVLSWSRQVFLRFYLSQEMGCFLAGHTSAFEFLGGVPKKVLYDNLKTAVLEHQGNLVRFNEKFISYAAHHRFEPVACGVRRANEKGRVERTIGYVRTSFFAGRNFKCIEDLNLQALAWCTGLSGDRQHPDDSTLTVRSAWEQEKPLLLPMPENPYSCHTITGVRIGRTPYARIDGNDYSVPPKYVRSELSAFTTEQEIIITHGKDEVARHVRSWSRGERIENPAHIAELIQGKQGAKKESALGRVQSLIPSSRAFIEQMHQNGSNIGGVIQSFLKCIDQYGALAVEAASAKVVEQGSVSLSNLRITLDRLSHEKKGSAHIVPIEVTNAKARNISVARQPLSAWDTLFKGSTNHDE
jgi:transposase